jgi:dihydroorotase
MNAPLVLQGGRVVDPSLNLDEEADVLIEDGKISAIGHKVRPGGDFVRFDAKGLVVCPGFIEGRAQFGEPGYEHRESMASGLRAAAAGGFTGVVGLPATQPCHDTRAVTELLMAEATRQPFARYHPVAALSRGLAGEELTELGEMTAAGAVAVSDGARPVRNAALLRRALLYARHFDLPVLHRPADRELDDNGVMHEGEWSTRLGLPGLPALSEEVTIARDLLLAAETGGRYHLSLLSTAGGVEQVRRAKAAGLAITCDVAIHHLLLTDRAVADTVFSPATKVRPPLRAEEDRAALLKAVTDGTIDAIVSDHHPHHGDEKNAQFSVVPFGVSGLETVVGLCLDRLVHAGVIGFGRLVELLAAGPARIHGLPGGTLQPGAAADITVLDPERRWLVDPARFHSKGRCTPFAGASLRGAPYVTFVGGRRVAP